MPHYMIWSLPYNDEFFFSDEKQNLLLPCKDSFEPNEINSTVANVDLNSQFSYYIERLTMEVSSFNINTSSSHFLRPFLFLGRFVLASMFSRKLIFMYREEF